MWFLFALVSTLGWGFADLFYKKSSDGSDRYSHLKIAVWVGIVMGVSALVILPFCEQGVAVLSLKNLISYAPASLSYIISMVIGYAGFRYLEVSILSPVENSSGALSAVFMSLFFVLSSGNIREALTEATGFVFDPSSTIDFALDILLLGGLLFICVGVIALAFVEQHLSNAEAGCAKEDRKYHLGALALLFPLLYCIFDTIGTAADGIILDESTGFDLGELDVLVLYGLTFMVIGLGCWLFLWWKEKKPYNPIKDIKTKGVAALLEEFGQVFYVFAMAARPVLAAPMIASYCIVSIIASRVFLGEKVKRSQALCIFFVVFGIVLLGITDGILA